MSTRTVTGKILRIDSGIPWRRGRIIFELEQFGYIGLTVNDPIVPAAKRDVLTNEQGEFEIDLWANDNSEKESIYRCILPSQESFRFILPADPSPITINQLIFNGPPVPQQPSSLIAFCTNRQNHYNTQLASTISDFETAALAALVAPGVPPLIGSSGLQGQRIYFEGYIYECVAPNNWRRYRATIF